MYQPELFVRLGLQARRDTLNGLQKYFKLLHFKDSSRIMDVGCGPGNVTHDILYPLLPKNIEKLIGVDISPEMIQYATTQYGTNSKISFEVMDILTDRIPKEFEGSVDCIFSFYCLHFVKDTRKAIVNMHKMLKQSGRIFINFVSQSFYHDICISLVKMDKWKNVIENFTKYDLMMNENSGNFIKNILDDIGFKTHFCIEEKKVFVYGDVVFRELIPAVSHYIAETLKDDFIFESTKYMKENGFVKIKDGQEYYHAPYTLLTLYATKL